VSLVIFGELSTVGILALNLVDDVDGVSNHGSLEEGIEQVCWVAMRGHLNHGYTSWAGVPDVSECLLELRSSLSHLSLVLSDLLSLLGFSRLLSSGMGSNSSQAG